MPRKAPTDFTQSLDADAWPTTHINTEKPSNRQIGRELSTIAHPRERLSQRDQAGCNTTQLFAGLQHPTGTLAPTQARLNAGVPAGRVNRSVK
jgi:hypothetical protein